MSFATRGEVLGWFDVGLDYVVLIWKNLVERIYKDHCVVKMLFLLSFSH